MSEENNFLLSSNNVFIELFPNLKDNYFDNLLNPDRNVIILSLIYIIFLKIVNLGLK